jgi:hypothetical protein
MQTDMLGEGGASDLWMAEKEKGQELEEDA